MKTTPCVLVGACLTLIVTARTAATADQADRATWAEAMAAARASELDDQFATLQFDIRQRDVLSKATNERIWNGQHYVPTERSTADEIACSMFYGVFEKEPGEAQLRGEVAGAILE